MVSGDVMATDQSAVTTGDELSLWRGGGGSRDVESSLIGEGGEGLPEYGELLRRLPRYLAPAAMMRLDGSR